MPRTTRTHLANAPIHPALVRPVAVVRPGRELQVSLQGSDPTPGTILEATAGEP